MPARAASHSITLKAQPDKCSDEHMRHMFIQSKPSKYKRALRPLGY